MFPLQWKNLSTPVLVYVSVGRPVIWLITRRKLNNETIAQILLNSLQRNNIADLTTTMKFNTIICSVNLENAKNIRSHETVCKALVVSLPDLQEEPFRVPQNEDVFEQRSRSEIVCLMSTIWIMI